MIGLKVRTSDQTKRVKDAANKAAYRNFFHAAASIRKQAIESVEVTKEVIGYFWTKTKSGKQRRVKIYRPSEPGTPVHSHVNKGFIRRGIRFDANKERAVIGFTHSTYGDAMRVHEFGGTREGQKFDERPTMQPALQDNLKRFANEWRGSISD